MDNGTTAPLIPAGTQPTVWGTKSFLGTPSQQVVQEVNQGQAAGLPDTGKSEPVGQPVQQSSEAKAPTGTTYDELVAKKGFKSADDLAAAYANLESQNKRVEMSLAELVKLREEVAQQSPTAIPPELAQQAVQTQEEAIRVVDNLIVKRTRPLEDKLALQELFYKNPDAQQYAVEMAKVIKENPGVSWDTAYKAAKFDNLAKEANERKKVEVQQMAQQKQAVLVGAQKATTSQPTRSLQDLVNDKNIPFIEIQRIMRERFSQ